MKKGFLIMLLIILFIFFGGNFFSFFQLKPVSMIQYAGKKIANEAIDRPEIVISNAAKIGEYNIVTSKDTFRNEPVYSNNLPAYGCRTNTCNGELFGKDLFGCEIYSISYAVWCDKNGCCDDTCNGLIGWQCTSGCPGCSGTCSEMSGHQETRVKDCGGYGILNQIDTCCGYSTCWGKYDIYKNSQLLQEIPWMTVKGKSISLEGLKVVLHQNDLFAYGECYRIENTFAFEIPENSFNFDVSTPKQEYAVGENAVANVKITNSYKNVKAKLSVSYEIPTAIGPATKEDTKIVDVSVGENIYSYLIPTEMTTHAVYITPKLDIVMLGSEFAGVNGICYGQTEPGVRDLSGCSYVLLGTLQGDKFVVRITPTTIYKEIVTPVEIITEKKCIVNIECPEHFECDIARGLCIQKISIFDYLGYLWQKIILFATNIFK